MKRHIINQIVQEKLKKNPDKRLILKLQQLLDEEQEAKPSGSPRD
jgi:hypothetical protein